MPGDVEVRVKRGGKVVATIKRPVCVVLGLPAVSFGQRWWPLDAESKFIDTDGPDVDELASKQVTPPDQSRPALGAAAPPAAFGDIKQHVARIEALRRKGEPARPHGNMLAGSSCPTAIEAFVLPADHPVSAPSNARLLIDAGPGTGKTHAACSRVVALVNSGISPTRIWLISFTRTAVVEIRNRIAMALTDPADASSIRIATLDSYAWALQSGFSAEARLTGDHEQNIQKTLEMVRADQDVHDELERIEHLVVDEAQDIVGSRAELVLSMIDALDAESGVSVFADRAQAIYGFAEKDSEAPGIKLVDALFSRGFVGKQLTQVHRTSDPKLLEIFTDLRQELLARKRPRLEAHVAQEIRRLAHQGVGRADELDITLLPEDALVLMRNRLDVLDASARAGLTPHRLRMSGLPYCVMPWIACMFWDYLERRISCEDFLRRWAARRIVARISAEEAWKRCFEVAGESLRTIDLHRLRSILSRSGPPMMFCSPEFGTSGPVIGTIHASKGREASVVHLYLPDRIEPDSTGEESRVMFVGATRARHQLGVGTAALRRGQNTKGRAWSKSSSSLRIEVGQSCDIDASGLVGRQTFSKQEAALAAQRALVEIPFRERMTAKAEGSLGWAFVISDGHQRLGALSQIFRWHVHDIGQLIGRRVNWLGHIRSIGVRTLAVAPDSPQLEEMLEPWRSSGFLFAPMISCLSYAPLQRSY